MTKADDVDIVVNGTPLNEGQKMALWVAIQSYAVECTNTLIEGQVGDQEKMIFGAYLARLGEISALCLIKTATQGIESGPG